MKETTRRLLFVMFVLLGLLITDAAVPSDLQVSAMCNCPCPSAPPWVKVDGLNSTTYTYTPPDCKKVISVCYKSSTTCKDYTTTASCGAPVTVVSTVKNQNGQVQDLSHASFKLADCECACVPDPEPSCDGHCGETLKWNICVDGKKKETSKKCDACPCVPDPEPTNLCEGKCGNVSWTDTCGKEHQKDCGTCPCVPTEDGKPVCAVADCGKTLEWINNCGDKKYVTCPQCECVPSDCGHKCGYVSDGCGGTLDCGNCPPPPPPPAKKPEKECEWCDWSVFMTARVWTEYPPIGGINTLTKHVQYFYFKDPNIIRQMILEADQTAEYVIFFGQVESPDLQKKVFTITGPGIVTIPIPSSGFPVQQFTEMWFTGGDGRLTIFTDNDGVFIKSVDYTVAQ